MLSFWKSGDHVKTHPSQPAPGPTTLKRESKEKTDKVPHLDMELAADAAL